ncbi:MAG: hypothetical protein ILA52_00395, partial [Alphaproteobacteria bacterium]|nr:hypothetical protein [Alphaproteobacteria bacterium]
DTVPVHSESSRLIYKLQRYIENPFNVIRGGIPRNMQINGTAYVLGFAEMRILGNDGTVYAAPNEIVADIMERRYQPPAEFIQAVINGIDPDSPAYQKYTSRYNMKHYWGASDEEIRTINEITTMIQEGDLNALKACHERNSILDIVTANGSVLGEAINSQKEEIAYWLLEAGVSLERFEGVELLAAINQGMEDLALRLLAYVIPMNTDTPADNPLFLAVARGKNKIAVELFRKRNDLVQTYSVDGMGNCNIFQWAKKYKNMAFLRSLIQ